MPTRHPTLMLAVLYASAFVAAFNENIVNVALVAIMGDFSISATLAQWLVTGYMMVTTVVVVVSAFLYRRFGLRRLFFIGVVFLVSGSIAAIFATSFPTLLVLRLAQAIGTGIFIPTMMTTVLLVAPRRRLGLYLAVGGMMITFGPAFGPVVAGLMVTLFGWHAIFLPTLVAVLLIGAAAVFVVRDVADPVSLQLDLFSVVLIAAGVFGLVFGLSEVTTRPGLAAVFGLAGVVVLAVFVRRQAGLASPVLDIRPMASARFWPASVLVVVAMMTTFSLSVLLPIYFQASLGMSALAAGALLLPPILINAATSVIGGRVVDAHGPWPLLFGGFATIAAGQAFLGLVAPRLDWVGVLLASAVVFAGVGLVLTPSQATGLASLSGPEHPHGVALLNTFIQVAASIGPALLIGVLSSGAAAATGAGADPVRANAAGFAQAILVAGAIAVVGAVVALVYSRRLGALRRGGEASPITSIARLMHTDVVSIPVTATVGDVLAQFVDKRVSGAPVIDAGGRVCGYITDGSILRAVSPTPEAATDLAVGFGVSLDDADFRRRAEGVMARNVMDVAVAPVTSVHRDAPVEDVARLLGARRLKKVPIVDSDGVLIGIATRGDLILDLLGTLVRAGGEPDLPRPE